MCVGVCVCVCVGGGQGFRSIYFWGIVIGLETSVGHTKSEVSQKIVTSANFSKNKFSTSGSSQLVFCRTLSPSHSPANNSPIPHPKKTAISLVIAFLGFFHYLSSSRKNMVVFHVASMVAGKIVDKTWKIQKACIENFYKTSMQHVKFSKTSKNSMKLYEIC